MAYSARIDELEKKFTENARRYFAPLANEYRKAGDLERAIEICRAHLPQQPGHMSGHIVYGQALYESRQLEEAKTVFEAALALDPENLIALRHLGDIARDSADPVTARSWYMRVLDADPRNDEVGAMLAELDSQPVADASGAAAPEAAGWGEINPERAPEAETTTSPESTDGVEATSDAGATSADEGIGAGLGETQGEDVDVEPKPTEAASPEVVRSHAVESENDARPERAGRPESRPPAVPSLDSVLDEAFATDSDAPESGQEPLSAAAFARPDAVDAEIAPGGHGGDASPPSPRRPSAALDDRALAEVDALFDEISPPEKGSREVPKPAAEVTGDSMFGDDTESAGASPAAGGAEVLGLETREFVPPPRPGPPEKNVRDTGSMAVSGLTSFEQPTEEDSSTRAAFVTETMAELYLQQGFTAEALDIYRQLLQQNPGDANLRGRIEQLEGGGRTSVAAVSPQVIEAAQQRHAARPVRTVRSFFGRLAGHHVQARDDVEADAPAVDEPVAAWTPLPDDDSDGPDAAPPTAPHIALVSDLFADTPVSEADEAAASMLASAFSPSFGGNDRQDPRPAPGRPAPGAATPSAGTSGRPAHTAGRELSLDQVFRESDRGGQRKSGGFSFDQFFSDGTQSSGTGSATDDQGEAEKQEAPEGDLEQFTAWLEGLKRK